MKSKTKNIISCGIVLFLTTAGICKLAAAEFDPSACPDLTAKIFQVNKDWAVFYVSADISTISLPEMIPQLHLFRMKPTSSRNNLPNFRIFLKKHN